MSTTWRQYYAPQIAAIIKANPDKSRAELRRVLYKANPGAYGHMRKIWSDESLKQLGLKKSNTAKVHIKQLPPGQMDLFK